MPNRILKESAFTSDKIAELSDFEFRLWAGLITQADDAGRGDARPAIIKGRVFPLRDRVTVKDIDVALHVLAAHSCVSLYEVGGKPYYAFPNWAAHQRVRDAKPKYPGIEDSDGENDNSPQLAATRGESPQLAAERGGARRSAEIRGEVPQSAALIQSNPNPNPNPNQNQNQNPIEAIASCAAPKIDAPQDAVISLPLSDKTEYAVSPEQCHEWAGLYPAVDVIQQLRNMRGWLDANPSHRKTRNGIKRFINGWLAREQNKAGRGNQHSGGNVFLDIAREEGLA